METETDTSTGLLLTPVPFIARHNNPREHLGIFIHSCGALGAPCTWRVAVTTAVKEADTTAALLELTRWWRDRQ